jgi:aldehyde:ferredoxin oxidoreductase
MENLSSGQYIVIDLESKRTEKEYIEEDFFEENIGGARANTALYRAYEEEDPIVVGTGLLTGTLAPGSALGIITGKSPITGKLCHAPFFLWAGAELKYAGFDYMVIKGKAEIPLYLWVHDGLVDLKDAYKIWEKDVWDTVDHVRFTLGEDLIQMLTIGVAGEKQADFNQIGLNYWNSGDLFALGSVMGEKNLKTIAMRGMGTLDIDSESEFVNRSLEIAKAVRGGALSGKKGNVMFPGQLGLDPVEEWIGPLVHRYSGCFACPYCCNTFLKYHESPDVMKETKIKEPGVMITDVAGLMGFKEAGMDPKNAGMAVEICARAGVNPVVISSWAKESGANTPEDLSKEIASWTEAKRGVENIAPWPISDETAKIEAEEGLFSPWTPPLPIYSEFDLGDDPRKKAEWWKKRNAMAYNLGICPILALLSSELEQDALVELVKLGTGIELDKEMLSSIE